MVWIEKYFILLLLFENKMNNLINWKIKYANMLLIFKYLFVKIFIHISCPINFWIHLNKMEMNYIFVYIEQKFYK